MVILVVVVGPGGFTRGRIDVVPPLSPSAGTAIYPNPITPKETAVAIDLLPAEPPTPAPVPALAPAPFGAALSARLRPVEPGMNRAAAAPMNTFFRNVAIL